MGHAARRHAPRELDRRALVLCALVAGGSCAHAPPGAPAMERIETTADGRGFRLVPSGARFVPWGFNYDRDDQHHLIEDYWDSEWTRVEEDFREMKQLGATVVRVHIQLARFMRAPDAANEPSLARLERLLALAESAGLYIDLTGLGSYRRADVPAWYRDASESDRWAIQARFWAAVAARCARSPAVFAYNLMNEPVSPAARADEWAAGSLGGLDYVERLTRDPAGRSRVEIARQWMATLIPAIRKHDRTRLITVGTFYLKDRAGALSLGENVRELAQALDYLSVHVYPKEHRAEESIALLAPLAVGKPIIIEETFPLNCSLATLEQFLEGSRAHASGWIGFYWGKTLEECRGSPRLEDAIMASWLQFFRDSGARFRSAPK